MHNVFLAPQHCLSVTVVLDTAVFFKGIAKQQILASNAGMTLCNKLVGQSMTSACTSMTKSNFSIFMQSIA